MLVTADTSHDPIGPCEPVVQLPRSDSLRHVLTARLSSAPFCGEHARVEAGGREIMRVCIWERQRKGGIEDSRFTDSPLQITDGKMPTLSAINIVCQKKEVMRICASHAYLREENTVRRATHNGTIINESNLNRTLINKQ